VTQTAAGGRGARSWPEMEALRADHWDGGGQVGVLGRVLHDGVLAAAGEDRKERGRRDWSSREARNDFESILNMRNSKPLEIGE